jgi:hypothetical protein
MGQVIAFPATAGQTASQTSLDYRGFIEAGWRVRQQLQLPRHKVIVFEHGGGWGWRVEHTPTGKVRWGNAAYRTPDAAKRACWDLTWPGEGE